MHFPHNHRGSYFTVYREGDWKLVYYYNPEHPERPDCILYNLKDDPEERAEVSEKYPQKTLELLGKMEQTLTRQGAQYPVDFEGRPVPMNIQYFKDKWRL